MNNIISFEKVIKIKNKKEKLKVLISSVLEILKPKMKDLFFVEKDINQAENMVKTYFDGKNIENETDFNDLACAFNVIINLKNYYIDETQTIVKAYKANVEEVTKLKKELYKIFNININDFNIFAPFDSKKEFLNSLDSDDLEEFKDDLELMINDLVDHAEKAMEKDDFQLSLDLYKQALKFDQNNELIYIGIGICYVGLEKYNNAILYFKKAADINPDNTSVIKMINECHKLLSEKKM